MPTPPDQDRRLIERTTAELLAAVNTSDVARVLAVWADDGVLMPPHHPAVRGRSALDQYFRDLFCRRRVNFAFTSSEIQLAGDAAFERVTYVASTWPATGGSAIEDVGKGLHVYRREADGSWKLAQDIWNSDVPARHLRECSTPPREAHSTLESYLVEAGVSSRSVWSRCQAAASSPASARLPP
jgi:uncharacterized protein (TIGR02246 family)